MELLIAILLSWNVLISPGSTREQIRASHQVEYDRAQALIDNNTLIDATSGTVIIIDETGNHH